jgi:uncharacterized protein (TIGR03083 family)
MSTISGIISDLEFGRAEILKAVVGLSHHEMTQVPIFDDWTVKDVLCHIIGWDEWTLANLPLILQNRASEISAVNPDTLNQQSLEAWHNKSLSEVLTTISTTHQKIVEIIASLDHKEIDMRRTRGEQTITIRSYVIDIMVDHERQHAEEIQQWREALDNSINPKQIRAQLRHSRDSVLATLEGLSEADLLDNNCCDGWSVKDVLAHLAAWEGRILNGARHLIDAAQPAPRPIDSITGWNDEMAAYHAERSWPEVQANFIETRQELNDFLDELQREDWKQRGPYPWPDDQGTLAELITVIAEHDVEHTPELEQWHNQKKPHTTLTP